MRNNGFVIHELQGTKKDFIGAWVMRLLGTIMAAAILWVCKLILASVMYLVHTLPPMQEDVNTLKQDMKSLKETTATKAELSEAEKRVKQEFAETLKKASRNRVVNP